MSRFDVSGDTSLASRVVFARERYEKPRVPRENRLPIASLHRYARAGLFASSETLRFNELDCSGRHELMDFPMVRERRRARASTRAPRRADVLGI